jgi:hypothetical protein
MILDDTNVSLEAVLEAAVATTQPDFVVEWIEHTTTAATPDANAGALNGVTAAELVAAPGASAAREIKRLSIYNRDTAEIVVRVRLKRASTSYCLGRFILPVAGTLEWSAALGFRRSDKGLTVRAVAGRATRDLFTYWHVTGGGGVAANYPPGVCGSTAITTQACVAANFYAKPFIAPYRRAPTVGRIGVYVTTGVAASNMRLGIYDSRMMYQGGGRYVANAHPSRLLYDSGDLSTASSAAAVTASPALVLQPGRLYWAVGFTSAAITLRAAASSSNAVGFGCVDTINATGHQNGFYGPALYGDPAATYGALPTLFPFVAASVGTPPAFFIRWSA